MISSLDYGAHFGGHFFGWKSENAAGWPNTNLKVLESNQAKCPNGQMSAIGADSKCFGKQQSGNYA